MKMLAAYLLMAVVGQSAFGQNQKQAGESAATTTVVERGRDHRVVETTISRTNEFGKVSSETRRFTELATGLHYKSGDEWLESKELVEAFPDGVIARQGALKAVFAPNLNTRGAIDVEGPDGKRIRSHLLGLVYRSEKAGQNAVIAEVQDAPAEIFGANQVVYRDAMKGAKVTVRYRVTRDAIEQDILIEDIPGPEEFGLPADAHLEAWTELVESPAARIENRLAGDLPDQLIELGSVSLVAGKAFALSGADRSVAVGKSITDVAGRRYLIETVKFAEVRPLLARPQAAILKPRNANLASRVSGERRAPAPKLVAANGITRKPVSVATLPLPEKSVVMDYSAVITATNFTFKMFGTYFASGAVNLSGTTTFEGLSVLKFTNGAQIKLLGPAVSKTAQYQNVILTSMDDNSAGETITGSSGSPAGFLADAALYLDAVSAGTSFSLSNFRILYAKVGVLLSGGTNHSLKHFQILHSQRAFQMENAMATMGNVLLYDNQTNFHGFAYTNRVEHLTVNEAGKLSHDTVNPAQSLLAITNSLIVSVTNATTVPWQTNAVVVLSSGSGVFEVISAGKHYLPTNSIYRNAGVTNISILTDLAKRTTTGPILYTNATLSGVITGALASVTRNLGDIDVPDLGAHYDPIDYIFNSQLITNCTWTWGPGVVIGYYGPIIGINDDSSLTATGTPDKPARLVYRLDAQEESLGHLFQTGNITFSAIFKREKAPELFRFVDFNLRSFYLTYFVFSGSRREFRDSVFRGGHIVEDGSFAGGTNIYNTFTNNLFLNFDFGGGTGTNYFQGNTFIAGNLSMGGIQYVQNNFLDGSSFGFPSGSVQSGYNAFTWPTSGGIYGFGTNKRFLTNHVWQTGPSGSYYLPTNTLAIDGGSTNASEFGLFHYTTQTSQVKETNSVVDIGYHYVAVAANGLPIDTDSDGIPDNIEDYNGNGIVDGGEGTYLLAPTVSITTPVNGFVTNAATNLTVSATATPTTNATIAKVRFFADGSLIGEDLSSPFSLTWSNFAAGVHSLSASVVDSFGATNYSVPLTVYIQSLTATGAVWKYLDNGSNQGTAWRSNNFSDASWSSGPAPLGYGDPHIVTTVGYGSDPNNKYVTTYFRKSISVSNPSLMSNVVVRLLRDDGAVIYVNGTEVVRDNMPTGTIYYTNFAPATIGGTDETTYYPFLISPTNFVNGTNVIAAEIHQSTTNSSDLGFDLSIIGNKAGPIVNLTAPTNGSSYIAGTNLTLTAWAAEPLTGIRKVIFYRDSIRIGETTNATSGTNYSFTWSNAVAGTFQVTARAIDGVGLFGNSTQQVSLTVRSNALFVVGNPTLSAADSAVSNRLNSLGYVVTVKQDSSSTTNDAVGKTVVVISSTITPANVTNRFRISSTPVVCWEPGIFGDMALTSTNTANFGTTNAQNQMVIQLSSHPLAAGLSGTVTVTSNNAVMSWGTPGSNAVIIATQTNNTNHVLIFGYEMSKMMVGTAARSRRVGFFLSDTNATSLNSSGWSLFDAAIRWAAEPPCFPAVDAMVVIDHSSSMNGKPLLDAKFASSNFVASLQLNTDKGGVASFDSGSILNQMLTNNSSVLISAINAIGQSSGSRIDLGIQTGQAELSTNRHNAQALPVMVLLTDGNPSGTTISNVLYQADLAKNAGTRIITVGFGTVLASNLLSIASSPSDFFYTLDSSELGDVYASIAASLCRNPNTPPTVQITNPAPNSVFPPATNITFQASASDADGFVSKVEYFNGVTKIGESLTPPYTVTWSNVSSGSYTITAKATDDDGLVGTSSNLLVSVNYPPTIAITNLVNNQFFATSPTNILVLVSANDPDGTIHHVELYRGTNGVATNLIEVAYSAPYQFLLPSVTAGTNVLRARAVDNHNANATSAPVTIYINYPPTVQLTSPTNGNFFTNVSSITLSATATDGATGSVARVDFYIDGTNYGQDASSPFSISWPSPTAGTHQIQAKAVDNSGGSHGSSVATITVFTDHAPRVYAGSDQIIRLPGFATLNGAVLDDNIPAGDNVGVFWQMSVGPGGVTFTNQTSAVSTASFGTPGLYQITLTATNAHFTNTSSTSVTVLAPPGTNVTIGLSPTAFVEKLQGNSQIYQAWLMKPNGRPYIGFPLTFEAWGASTPTNTVATDTNGYASYTLNGTASGTNYIRASAWVDGIQRTTDVAQASWEAPTSDFYGMRTVPYCGWSETNTLDGNFTGTNYARFYSSYSGSVQITFKTIGPIDGQMRIEMLSPSGKTLATAENDQIVYPNGTNLVMNFWIPKEGWYVIHLYTYLPTSHSATYEFTFDCSGGGTYPELDVFSGTNISYYPLPNDSVLDFGTVSVGSSATNYLTLTNSGNGFMYVSPYTVLGDYTVSPVISGSPYSLNPGNTLQMEIHYVPTRTSVTDGHLYLPTSDTRFDGNDESFFHVILRGSAAAPGTPPAIAITSPLDGQTIAGCTPNINLTVNAIAGDGMYSVTYYTNGQYFAASFYPPFGYYWSGVPAGDYVFTALASDLSGHTTMSDPVHVRAGMHTLSLSFNDACPNLTNETVTVTARLVTCSGSAVSGSNVQFTVTGANPASFTATTDGSGYASISYVGKKPGLDSITASTTVAGSVILSPVAHNNWATPLALSQLVSATMGSTNGISDTATKRNGSYYSIYLEAGKNLLVTLSSPDFDTMLYLRQGDCTLLATNDDNGHITSSYLYSGATQTDSQITYSITQSGYYIIEATSFEEGATGIYYLVAQYYDPNGAPSLQVTWNGTNFNNYGVLDFGAVGLAQTVTRSLILTNAGNTNLTIGPVSITGDYTVTTAPASLVAPGSTTTLAIRFNAATNGVSAEQATFVNSDADLGEGLSSPFVINLVGICNTNVLAAAPTVSLTSPTNNAIYKLPANSTEVNFGIYAFQGDSVAVKVPLSANASAASGTITNVEFFVTGPQGRTSVGSRTNAPYIINWPAAVLGTYYLNAVAKDSSGRSTNSPPITVQIVLSNNHKPVATNDFPTVFVNSVNNVLNVLTNDTDIDGDELTIISVQDIKQGVPTIINNGKGISYTPPPFSYGQENFSYTISDGQGGTATAWVIVNVQLGDNPDIKVASPPNGFGTNAGNNVLIVASSANSNSLSKVEFYVNGDKIGEDTSGPDFSFNWTPVRVGTNTLKVVATDSVGRVSASASVTVTNGAPAGDNAPIASFLNLTNQVQVINGRSVTNTAIVRDGLFVLTGSAYDPDTANNPASYRLRLYQPDGTFLGDMTPLPLVNGFHVGSVTNGILATNDFTLLRNGPYRLEMTVRGGYWEIVTNVNFALDTELKVGQFSFSQQDVTIPVNGLPLSVTRTYSTLNPNSGDFGYGWTYSINDVEMTIAEDREAIPDFETEQTFSRRIGGSRDVTLTLPDGRRTTFFYYTEPAPSDGEVPSFAYLAKWAAAPGVYDRLEALGDNSLVTIPGWTPFWAAAGIGTPMENFDFPGFLLTLRDGTKFRIEREDLGTHFVEEPAQPGQFSYVQSYGQGVLKKITQRTGDTVVILPGLIQHFNATNQLTRTVLFERDGLNRIIAIRDPNSASASSPATVKYAYNNDGNLISVSRLVDATLGTYLTTSYEYDNTSHIHYITSIKDPRGITPMRTLYDVNGRMVGTIDAYGKTNTFAHDVVGRTETIYDRNGNPSVHVYDTRGNITTSTDALGRTTQRTYDLLNNVLLEIDPLLNTNSYAYDATGNRLFSTNALGQVTSMTYNTNNQVLTVTDPRTNTTWNTYDPISGELVATTNALGQVTRMLYNTNNLLVAQIDALGNIVTNQYDGLGNLTNTASLNSSLVTLSASAFSYDSNGNRVTEAVLRTLNGSAQWLTNTTRYDAENRAVDMTDPLGQTSHTVYNEIGQQSSNIDKLGRTTSYQYSLRGELLKTTYPDSTTESTVYDDDGRRIASINRLGYTNRFEYDAVGRLTNSINPDATHSSTVYDAAGRAFLTIDARGFTNSFAYDAAGRRTFTTNALGQVSSYTYDPTGNQLVFKDANQNSTTNVYDALNRVIQVLLPDGTLRQTFYDVLGRRIAETDQATNTVWFGFDSLGRLTSVTNMLSQITRYNYDETGLQTNQVDALNRTTSFEYDALGRRIKRRLPGSQVELYSYDALGNLTRQTNFNGVITTNLYDVMNRLQAQVFADGTSNTFTYSASGQRLTMTDQSGAYTYAYDVRDRLRTNTTPAGTLFYKYDENGNLTNLTSSTTGGTLLTYQFDSLNRLTNAVDGQLTGTKNTAYRFDSVGNLQSLSYPNGITNLYQYNSLNRLTNLSWKLNGSQRGDFAYKLGWAGNRTNLSDTVNGTSRTFNWQYDPLYRLTNEVVSGGTSGNLGYAYDSVGNRTNRTGSLGSLGAVTSSYNTNDWLTGDVYDNNGNTRTNASSQPYFYDVQNRLTNFNNGAVIITYNADGNRVKKVAGGVTTLFLVDMRNLSGYAQVLEELTVSGGTTNLAKAYTYGLDLISQRVPSTSTNFFGYDGLGSTRFLLNAAGTLTENYAYDAYGTLVASNIAPSTVYLYAGEQFDPDLGLYYNRARYLKSDTGRFWTMDSYEGSQTDPLSLHKYLYGADNPVDNKDPSGHEIEGLLTVMDISSSLFAQISPATSAAAVTAGVAGTSRPLTQGEINLAQTMFGGKINYTKVNVIHKKAFFFQPKDTLITPDGNIYAHPKGSSYSTDYSSVSIYPPKLGVPIEYTRALFIHEMTHVWQFQTTGSILGRALYRKYEYDFSKLGTIKFTEYGIEQQGDIVMDYYLLKNGQQIYRNGTAVQNPPSLQTYQKLTSPYFP